MTGGAGMSKVTEGEKQLIAAIAETVGSAMADGYRDIYAMVAANLEMARNEARAVKPKHEPETREGVLCPLRNWAPCLVGCASWLLVGGCQNPGVKRARPLLVNPPIGGCDNV